MGDLIFSIVSKLIELGFPPVAIVIIFITPFGYVLSLMYRRTLKKCQKCTKFIPKEASVCPKCGSNI
jgi:uncharacterized paraquat-inducible protein A